MGTDYSPVLPSTPYQPNLINLNPERWRTGKYLSTMAGRSEVPLPLLTPDNGGQPGQRDCELVLRSRQTQHTGEPFFCLQFPSYAGSVVCWPAHRTGGAGLPATLIGKSVPFLCVVFVFMYHGITTWCIVYLRFFG